MLTGASLWQRRMSGVDGRECTEDLQRCVVLEVGLVNTVETDLTRVCTVLHKSHHLLEEVLWLLQSNAHNISLSHTCSEALIN